MLTLTPEEIATENHDIFSYMGWHKAPLAPGIDRSHFWGQWDAYEGAARAGLLTPRGVHDLLLLPLKWRNPDPVARPHAWNLDEAFWKPVEHNGYQFDVNYRYNHKYSAGEIKQTYLIPDEKMVWNEALTKWSKKGQYVHVADQRYAHINDTNRLVPSDEHYIALSKFYDELAKLSEAWQRDRHAMITAHKGKVPWTEHEDCYNGQQHMMVDDFRRPLFRLARRGAKVFKLDLSDSLHYLEGIDEHLGRPFMWYLHHSLQALLSKQDRYKRHAKRQVEFLGSISELRAPMQAHRTEIATNLQHLWQQHNAQQHSIPVPHTEADLSEFREQVEEGFRGMVKWYLSFPGAYEDLVLAHDGPASIDVVPGSLDFDERLHAARQDLMLARRQRHLIRLAV